MRKLGTVAVLAAVLTVGTGCGGGSSDNFNVSGQLQDCIGDGVGYLFGLIQTKDLVESLIIQNGLATDPFASVTPGTAENSWDFDVQFDIDGDGENETNITGTITFSADPTDGIDSGDTAVITFDIAGSEGLGGSGMLNVTYGESGTYMVYGDGNVDLPGDCGVTFDIPMETPLNFGFSRLPRADFLGREIFGRIFVAANANGNSIQALLEMFQDDNTVVATNVEINGVGVDDFDFDLGLDSETLFTLNFCAIIHFEGTFLLLDSLLDAVGTFVDGEDFTEGALQITNQTLTSFDFTITYNGESDFDEGDTVSGSVALSGPPTPGSTVTITLSFSASLEGGEILVRTLPSQPVRVVAQLANTQPSEPIEAESLLFSGRVECVFEGEFFGTVQDNGASTCRAVTIVDQNTPIDLEQFLDGPGADATFTIESFYDGHMARFAVTISDDNVSSRSYFDGIPVPSDELFFFFFVD